MIDFADVIVDCQSGDTGKGKIANALVRSGFYDIVLRYNGGSNAGHTVYNNGQKVVTHQVPVGVLHGVMGIIGPGCVVNVTALCREIQELMFLGFNTNELIFVDKRAHLVTEKHLQEDCSDEKIGTTRQGIGPAYRDKYGRIGKRIGDDNVFSDFGKEFSSNLFQIVDIYEMLHTSKEHYRILCEGAQGFNLDIDWGNYPYVTTSHCTVGSACLNGIPPKKINEVYGVIKAYETYVGNNTTFTDASDKTLQEIQRVGNEFGATTGRPRMVNWLNVDKVIQALNINGVTTLYINKGDVLREVGTYKVIVGDDVISYPTYDVFKTEVNRMLNHRRNIQIIWSEHPEKI